MLRGTIFENEGLAKVLESQIKDTEIRQKDYILTIENTIKGTAGWLPVFTKHSSTVKHAIAPFPALNDVANEMKKNQITLNGKSDYCGNDLTSGNKATDFYYDTETRNLSLWDDSGWNGYGYD